jgi:hypothetical protein
METEQGKQVGMAIQAVLQMQADCIRLFRDLDKALNDLRPISGNTVTSGTGYAISAPQLYLPQLLFRRYAPVGAEYRVLGINVCLHNHPKRLFDEPIFVVANVQYIPATSDATEESWRAWDPWAAFLDWGTDTAFGKALTIPPRRSTIEKIVVAAVPLYSITSLEAAIGAIDLVGRPSGERAISSSEVGPRE